MLMSHDPKKAFVARLKELIPDGGQGDIARKAGLSREVMSRYLSEKMANPKLSTLIALAQVFDVPVTYLIDDELEPLPEITFPENESENYTLVPLFADEVAAGPGTIMKDTVEERHAIRTDWLLGRIRGKPIRVRVSRTHHLGESMTNTILPGAVLTVDWGPQEDKDIVPYDIYIVRDENSGVMVKRVVPQPDSKSFLCISDNRAFPRFELYPGDGSEILGKVLQWEQGDQPR